MNENNGIVEVPVEVIEKKKWFTWKKGLLIGGATALLALVGVVAYSNKNTDSEEMHECLCNGGCCGNQNQLETFDNISNEEV